jgi:magnesium chelatase family protein
MEEGFFLECPPNRIRHCSPDSQAEELLHQAMTELNISARGYNKILKVGRTIV